MQQTEPTTGNKILIAVACALCLAMIAAISGQKLGARDCPEAPPPAPALITVERVANDDRTLEQLDALQRQIAALRGEVDGIRAEQEAKR